MRYIRVDVGPWPEKSLPWWYRVLQKVIPAANPDIEKFYSKVRFWWLEVDDKDRPQREIGFDSDGSSIVLGPIGDNYGFLIDSADHWSGGKEDSEAANKFQSTWESLWPKFKHLERNRVEPNR